MDSQQWQQARDEMIKRLYNCKVSLEDICKRLGIERDLVLKVLEIKEESIVHKVKEVFSAVRDGWGGDV